MQGRRLQLRKAQRLDYAKLGGGGEDGSDEEPGTGADYVEVAEDVSRPARSAPLCQILALEELHELWNCQGSVPPSIVLLDINSPLVLLPATLLQLLGADHQVTTFDCEQQREGPEWSLHQYCDYWHGLRHGSGSGNKRPPSADAAASSAAPKRRVISMHMPVHNTALQDRIVRPAFLSACDLATRSLDAAREASQHNHLLHTERSDDTEVHVTPTGSFTNFTLQPGAASAWLWVLTGKQVVMLVAPEPGNLAAYAAWAEHAQQAGSMLSRHTSGNLRADVGAGSCLLIPAGWCHAVCTEEAAVSLRGSFHPAACLGMQGTLLRLAKKLTLSRAAHHTEAIWHIAQLYTARLAQHARLSQQELQHRAQQRLAEQQATAAEAKAAKQVQAAARRKAAPPPPAESEVELSESDDAGVAVDGRPSRLAKRLSGRQLRAASCDDTGARRSSRSVKRKRWDAALVGGGAEDEAADDSEQEEESGNEEPTRQLRSAASPSPDPPAQPQKRRKLLVKLGSLSQPRQAPTNAELRAASQQLPSQGQQRARPLSGSLIVRLGGNRRPSGGAEDPTGGDQQQERNGSQSKKRGNVIPQSDGAGDDISDDEQKFPEPHTGAPAVGTEPAAGSLQDQPSLIQAENTLVSEAVLKLMDPIVQPSAPAALGANSAAAAASAEAANSEPEQPEFVSSSAVPAESAQHEGDSAAAADAPAAKGKLMLRKARLKVAGPVALGASKGASKAAPAGAIRKPAPRPAQLQKPALKPAHQQAPNALLAQPEQLSAENKNQPTQLHIASPLLRAEPQPENSMQQLSKQADAGQAISNAGAADSSISPAVGEPSLSRPAADEATVGISSAADSMPEVEVKLRAEQPKTELAAQQSSSQLLGAMTVDQPPSVQQPDAAATTAAQEAQPLGPSTSGSLSLAESAHLSAPAEETSAYALPDGEEVDRQLAQLLAAGQAATWADSGWSAGGALTEAERQGVCQLHALLAEQAHVASWWRPVLADAQHAQLLVARLAESMLANGLPIDSAPLVSLPSFDPRTLLPQRSSLQSSAQPKHTGPLPAEPLATASDSDSRMTQDEEPDAEEEGDSVLEQKLREGKRRGPAAREKSRTAGSVRSRLMKKLRFK